MDNIKDESIIVEEEKNNNEATFTISRRKLIIIVVCAVVVGTLAALQFYKGIFVAATVNGTPISRFSVISESESRSGRQVIDSLITEALIDKETGDINIPKKDIDSEIEKIEKQVIAQGQTLKDALAQQGMTEERLRKQIIVQKKVEILLADKITVSDEEVNEYIKTNKITPPKGQKLEDIKPQIKEQLKQEKFGQEAQQWLSDLKADAKIKYYVNY